MLTQNIRMLHLRIDQDMTQESRHSLRGKCGFRNKGRGEPFLNRNLGSGNTACSSLTSPARCRCPPATRGLYFHALALWDTLPPPGPGPDQGQLLTPSRGKKTSSLQIHSLRLRKAIHLEVRPAMSHLERIILSLRGVSLPKLPSFLVMETHLEVLLLRNQKCLQRQNNFSVTPITMRKKIHFHEQ